jgi:isopenicillin N synthase-like dioxygenase
MEIYLQQVQALSYQFISLLAEAFGLSSDALNKFYDTDELMQHRGKVNIKLRPLYILWRSGLTCFKVVKYPANDGSLTDQGVGPHYDAGFLTFLLTASPHRGLQVQNLSGQWIDVPPIPGTFVVNIGKGGLKATMMR